MIAHRDLDTDGGFTLIELLIAVMIVVIVMGSVTFALLQVTSQVPRTTAHMTSSLSGEQVQAQFNEDVQSASAVGSGPLGSSGYVHPLALGVPGCGGTSAVLRTVGRDLSGAVQVHSYVDTGGAPRSRALRRLTCTGPTLGAANAARPVVLTVVRDLASVTGLCYDHDGNQVVADPATTNDQCAGASLSVRTTTGYTFVVRAGLRITLFPTPTTTPIVYPPTHGSCTLLPSDDAYVDDRHILYADQRNKNHGGDQTFEDYNDLTTHHEGFLKFDLVHGTCTQPGEPPHLPGGQPLLSASLHLVYLNRAGGLPSNFQQYLEPLAPASTWSESTVTWNNRPTATQAMGVLGFKVQWNTPKTFDWTANEVLPTVLQWYLGAWPNNGWRLTREGNATEAFWTGWQFGSKENPTAANRPTLRITW